MTIPNEFTETGERTWKPTTAGILTVIGGIIGIAASGIPPTGEVWASIPVMAGAGTGQFVFGAIALVGGIFALRRRVWGLALAGAICAIITAAPLGILSIIFVSLGKREFA